MGVRAIRRATRGSLVYGVLRSFGTKGAIESKGTCDWVFQRLNDMLNKDGLLKTAQKSCTSFTFFAHYATLQAIRKLMHYYPTSCQPWLQAVEGSKFTQRQHALSECSDA